MRDTNNVAQSVIALMRSRFPKLITLDHAVETLKADGTIANGVSITQIRSELDTEIQKNPAIIEKDGLYMVMNYPVFIRMALWLLVIVFSTASLVFNKDVHYTVSVGCLLVSFLLLFSEFI